jgi:hypothetical protein
MKSLDVISAIESRFPHIAKALCVYWGHPECADYLDSLMIDQRGGRQGFPADVSAELLFLHSMIERKPGAFDAWSGGHA